MSDLNKKNINYGALNRFYQDLKSHDLSGLATEQYVDDAIATVNTKPITNVSVLPDAEANKDSVLRLEGDKKLYVAKYNSNNAPDSEQVGVAYISGDESESEYNKMYYSGTEVTIIANNGTFTGYAWLYDGLSLEDLRDANRISTIKASQIENTDALFYIAEYDIIYSSGTTFTCSANLNTTPMSNMDMSDGYYIKPIGYEWQRVVTEDELEEKVYEGSATLLYSNQMELTGVTDVAFSNTTLDEITTLEYGKIKMTFTYVQGTLSTVGNISRLEMELDGQTVSYPMLTFNFMDMQSGTFKTLYLMYDSTMPTPSWTFQL